MQIPKNKRLRYGSNLNHKYSCCMTVPPKLENISRIALARAIST